jgi:hypothetical protein
MVTGVIFPHFLIHRTSEKDDSPKFVVLEIPIRIYSGPATSAVHRTMHTMSSIACSSLMPCVRTIARHTWKSRAKPMAPSSRTLRLLGGLGAREAVVHPLARWLRGPHKGDGRAGEVAEHTAASGGGA